MYMDVDMYVCIHICPYTVKELMCSIPKVQLTSIA